MATALRIITSHEDLLRVTARPLTKEDQGAMAFLSYRALREIRSMALGDRLYYGPGSGWNGTTDARRQIYAVAELVMEWPTRAVADPPRRRWFRRRSKAPARPHPLSLAWVSKDDSCRAWMRMQLDLIGYDYTWLDAIGIRWVPEST
ncbi:hypothetical protein GCM10023205_20840 [Yinghuangia aomiensis]|uniref:Uncharacterized protein n=1 Tax=Yinghuangia aomiensis TaxID=676205 RepID=A0ABP9H0B0_9ACTN